MIVKAIIILIAIMHVGFFYMETIAWTTVGRKAFGGYPKEFFKQTEVMAKNQGVYNLFLAAGLIWSLFIQNGECGLQVSLFFLICVVVAGIAGAMTAAKKIFYIQSVPALLAILLMLL